MMFSGWIRLAQWFLSLAFTSVDPGSKPCSDQSLACGLGLHVIAWVFPLLGFPPTSETDIFFSFSVHSVIGANCAIGCVNKSNYQNKIEGSEVTCISSFTLTCKRH